MKRFDPGQCAGARLEEERAGESIGLAGSTRHVEVARHSIDGMVALCVAADEGVPVVRRGEVDEAEDRGGVEEAAGGGGGAEVKKLRAGIGAMEEAGD